MRIEAVGFQIYQPYIYNTNAVSGNSLSRVKPIGDDLLASGTDFSGMTEEEETLNPLRRGETANFADVLAMQMQMGRMNADRIMKPAEEAASAADSRIAREEGADVVQMLDTSGAAEPADGQEAARFSEADVSLYRRRYAAMAYLANMIA